MVALFWLWLLFTPLVVATPYAGYHNCSGGNFTQGGDYESYLKIVASDFPKEVSSSPRFFASQTIGAHVEQLNAIGSCREDMNEADCKSCVSKALQEAQVACPSKMVVIMSFEDCKVAFSDHEFKFSMNNNSEHEMSILQYNSSRFQSDALRKGATSLIGDVIEKAAELSTTHFATGRKEVDDTDGHKVYALAQCAPSLTPSDCKSCLLLLNNEEQFYSSEAIGGRICNIWCEYRWEVYKFFNGQPLLDLPAAAHAGKTDHHHHITSLPVWAIVILAVVGAAVVSAATVSVVWLWRQRKTSSGKKNTDVEKASKQAELTSMDGCPSALDLFEEVMNLAQGRRIALFLDYDGTLSPIVNDPDKAFMSEEMRSVVRKAAAFFPTSIVSGSARQKVMDFVEIMEINYAGSHGLDIMTATTAASASTSDITEECSLYEPAKEFLSTIDAVFEFLVRETDDIMGATVESNKYCISVHYRNVADEDQLHVKEIVEDARKRYSLKQTEGHMVYELRPPINWNKGHAVGYLLRRLGLDNPESTFSVYIGDDRTDEDAFQVLREEQRGIGILVSETPKTTAAFYSVKNPNEVQAFLEKLVEFSAGQHCMEL